MKSFFCVLALFPFVLTPVHASTIDFEGLLDQTSVTNQYAGVVFSNTTVLTAGLSLNEFEFPPASGVNAAFDDSGPMGLTFSAPVSSFSGFFTYTSNVTLTFYGAGLSVLGTVNSTWANNTALSGDAGSAPNELLSFSSLLGIQSIQIQGDPGGGSLVADDLTFTPITSSVPEPSAFVLVSASLAVLSIRRRRA